MLKAFPASIERLVLALPEVWVDRRGYLGDVEIPAGGSWARPGRVFVRGDMVLMHHEDEAGTGIVKRYRLVLPGEEWAVAAS